MVPHDPGLLMLQFVLHIPSKPHVVIEGFSEVAESSLRLIHGPMMGLQA